MKIQSSLSVRNQEVAKPSKALVKKVGVERVMCVIDTSFSMENTFEAADHTSRIAAVVDALHLIIDSSSRAITELGLISFNSSPSLRCQITDHFSMVKVATLSLEPHGATYYGTALKLALQSEPNRIILLSDGEAGDKTDALAMARICRDRHIRIDTVGIGAEGLDLLRQIAELTGGIFIYANNAAKLQETFAKLETRARLQLEHKK